MTDRIQRAARLVDEALRLLGHEGDPELVGTGERVATFLAEQLPVEPPALATFPLHAPGPVVVRDMTFHSLCAHHLLPFFGTASVAYRPVDRVLGLGGMARALRAFAERPQLEERLARQLADHLLAESGASSVAVRLEARQLCVEMRGARSDGRFVVFATAGADDPDLVALLLRG